MRVDGGASLSSVVPFSKGLKSSEVEHFHRVGVA